MLTVARGRGLGVVDPSTVGGRLSLVSGDPVPSASQVAKSTLYYTPYRHNLTSLYTGTRWVTLTVAELSIALSSLTSGRLYDVFLDYNDGTPQLVHQVWAGHGQAITGATNASPIVITAASHGLANDDQVYVSGAQDHAAPQLIANASPINGTYTVASAGATFALSGSVGVRAWIRGGYFSARLAAGLLARQDGVWVKAADPQQRYLGTFRATGTTTTEDSIEKVFVWNAANQVARTLNNFEIGAHTAKQSDNAAGWGAAPSTPPVATGVYIYRRWANSNGAVTVEWVQGLSGPPVTLSWRYAVFCGGATHVATEMMIDGTQVNEEHPISLQTPAGETSILQGTGAEMVNAGPGYHAADIGEIEVLNVEATILQGKVTGTIWA